MSAAVDLFTCTAACLSYTRHVHKGGPLPLTHRPSGISTIPDPSSTQQQLLPLYAIKKKTAPTQRGSPSRRGRARCPPPAPSFPGHLRPPPQQTVGSLPPWMVAGRRSSSAHLTTPPLPGSVRSRVVVIFPARTWPRALPGGGSTGPSSAALLPRRHL